MDKADMELAGLLQSLKPDELLFIAQRDYGEDTHAHLDALVAVMANGGLLEEGQHWHPYEVIELTAHRLVPGHERAFVACTLLVIAAVRSGFDTSTDLGSKLVDRAADYERLEPELRDSVLSAYGEARL
ncbi:hypothetical protein ABQZ69_21945 [Xanthomonas sp. WHRI 8391]|uniref:hypothetical protein n=1 Tax=Xanthomonas TaxID=338 RepID=UPI001A35C321|nr:hypothetical protein [Xanthomonas hortorum]MBG3851965.1 hypothetical protein [Xanthomonas hortorum pv. carotae]UTS74200.1 hypothetical protein NMB96_04990 [Xanthomonas hortorum]